jgi:hypothetical protein
MFSLTQIDQGAWVLFLLMGGWVVVNALVDLSSDRVHIGKSKDSADDSSEPRD